LFQSSLLLLASIGLLEVGFIYSTILVYVLMTIMFYEMLQVQARQDKEQHITVKSIWIQWYFYIGFQIYMISKTWLTEELLSNTGIELPLVLHQILFTYHSFFAFGLFAFGLIFFVMSLEEGFYSYQFK